MVLSGIDWAIVGAYFLVSLLIGLYYSRRAGKSVGEFFLSGRDLPWWLVGTSMVATTFAADTPLAVAGLVARGGIAGNWIWWSFALGGMFTVFFFARLWRRAGVMTDVELAEVRYAGRPASGLRAFRALYLGVGINCLIIGWVNVAMATILQVALGWDKLTAVLVCMAITGFYASLSGLWGVVVTDAFQFVFAMAGCIALAVIAMGIPEVGGVAGLRQKLPPETFHIFPARDVLTAFLAFVCVQWWASWYPGSEPGGGGYVVQRMLSAKDERHALYATLWFQVANFCLRPWPWIMVGLAALVLYPGAGEAGYVMVMRDHLPAGWRGVLVATFFAAYMSTISTQLNWGSSYVVSDFYRRFVRKDAPEQHYVWVSRAATIGLMVAGGLATFALQSVGGAWSLVLELGSGTGLVMMLRWYWWRVNAWSEISAMVAAAAGFAILKLFTDLQFPHTLYLLTAWTTLVWLLVTLLTPPEPEEHLIAFYKRAQPGGPGWRRIARAAGLPEPEPIAHLLVPWLGASALVYTTLFAVGELILSGVGAALPWLGGAAGSLVVVILGARGARLR